MQQNRLILPLLQQYGAKAVLFPCFYIETLQDHVQAALLRLATSEQDSVDVIFSSRHGVQAVLDCVDSLAKTLQHLRIVAIGQKTAALLQEHACKVAVIPKHASQQGLVDFYRAEQQKPKHQPTQQVFFFRAEQGSALLSTYFFQQGIPMQLIPSYRSLCVQENPADVVAKLKNQAVDAVLLGSAKVAAFYAQKITSLQLESSPVVVVMSPQVAVAADKAGLKVQVVAKQPSFAAMLDALTDYYSLS